MISWVIPLIFSFTTLSPSQGYTYTDHIDITASVPTAIGFNNVDTYVVMNYVDISGTLYYNTRTDYKLDIDYVSYDYVIYRGVNYVSDNYIEYISDTLTIQELENLTFYTRFNNNSILFDIENNNEVIASEVYNTNGSFNGNNNEYVLTTIDIGNTNIFERIESVIEFDLGGYERGYRIGYAEGHTEGFNEGASMDNTAVTIFNGILNIALVPVNFFLAMFNFEILGINISSLVSALLSVCMVIIVIRMITGKKNGD